MRNKPTVVATFPDGEVRVFTSKQKTYYTAAPKYAVRIRFPNEKVRILFGRTKKEIDEKVRTAMVAYLNFPSIIKNRPVSAWKRAEMSQFMARHGLTNDSDISALRAECLNNLKENCSIEMVQTAIA